jgi:hypothetical protein
MATVRTLPRHGDELRAEWKDSPYGRVVFAWSGGSYIDIGPAFGTAWEVWNVWDYAEGKATIPYTKEALRSYILHALRDQETRDALGDVFREMSLYG